MTLPALQQPALTGLREGLRQSRQELARRFLARPGAAAYLHGHAHAVDQLLATLCHKLLPPGPVLAAVGGYGRGELFPASDVDVLLLLPAPPAPSLERALESWVQACWDVGLEIGHSVRTVDACMVEAERDVTVETNLLEARLVWGEQALFTRFRQHFAARFEARRFFEAKLLEQANRHNRHADTASNLEPNIKESPGGLRDLHTIHWLARACGIAPAWRGLVQAGILSDAEARRIREDEAILDRLRIRLHLLARRREDRLAFDLQAELAKSQNIAATRHRLASEVLMQRYYRAAKDVRLAGEIIIPSLKSLLYGDAGPAEIIDDEFARRGPLLEIRDSGLFERDPAALFRAFLVLHRETGLTDFAPATLRGLWRAGRRVDARFRADPRNRRAFLELLRQPQGVTRTLRALNRYGILGRYLPAWGRIVGQMQHDLFHVYTVDEHILIVLRNLRRLTVPELAHEYPLAARLMSSFDRPELLYLAALFHDIAKGRGGDHSQLGQNDARRFCRAHGFSREDTDLVSWLVREHLSFSRTAQKEDLSDPEVVAAFARRIGSERRLTALYLLTTADIRGTSPKVWNAWKARLLDQLYQLSLARLSGDDGRTTGTIEARQEAARGLLSFYGLAPGCERQLWGLLDDAYFLRTEAADLAWHTRMLWGRANDAAPVVRTRLAPQGEGIQVLVYAPDQPDLFVRVCGLFARVQYSVLEARIHTTRHGYALDNFLVQDEADRDVHYRDFLSFLEYELARAIDPGRPVEPVPRGRMSRHQKHFPYPPHVELVPDDRGRYYVLTVSCADRAGLLYDIAGVFQRHRVNLIGAKIHTLGERVEDTFLLQAERLVEPATQAAIEQDLMQSLDSTRP